MNPPIIDGWFTLDEAAPALIGSRCCSCGSYYFPKLAGFCRNPDCESEQFEELPLSRTGTLWSFTNACYQPPAPYVAEEPFEPYAIAAVQLDREQMIVLGQVVKGVAVDDLRAGQRMQLVLEDVPGVDGERVCWKWRPLLEVAA